MLAPNYDQVVHQYVFQQLNKYDGRTFEFLNKPITDLDDS